MEKTYKVCGWQRNAHKIEYFYTNALIAKYDALDCGEGIEEAEEKVDQMENLMNWASNVKSDGIIYAPWKERCEMQELIAAYNITHGGR